MTLNYIRWGGSCSEGLGSVQYPSFLCTPKTLWPGEVVHVKFSSIGQMHFWKLLPLDRNTWNYLTVKTNDNYLWVLFMLDTYSWNHFTVSTIFVLRIVRIISKSLLVNWNQHISQVGRVFANGPGDLGLIPGRVIPKTLKMVLDISLLYTQQYKVRIKGKV